jgi:hypothetical protein
MLEPTVMDALIEVAVMNVSKHRRVRPSSLQMAEQCKRAPYLSIKHPASHAVTRFGSAVDQQVSIVLSCIATGDMDNLPTDEDLLPETSVILDWLEANYPHEAWEWHVQERVELLDPEAGEVLTAGTPDLLCLHRTDPVLVDIDWKKSGQLYAGHLQRPDQNIQQLAYVTAAWLKYSRERKIERAKIILACWDEKRVIPLASGTAERPWITEDRLAEVVERVRAVPPVDMEAPQPEASVGEHCMHCYQRMHCAEHLLPLAVVIQAGLPAPYAEFIDPDKPLVAETTVKALAWLEECERMQAGIKKIHDLVEGNVDAFVTQHGPVTVGELAYGPQEVKGKRAGATIKTLEKEGLARLIREGETKTKCKWYPSPKALLR